MHSCGPAAEKQADHPTPRLGLRMHRPAGQQYGPCVPNIRRVIGNTRTTPATRTHPCFWCNPTKPCIMIGSTKMTTRERSTTCPLFSRRASARIWLAWLVRCPTGLPAPAAWPMVLAQVVYCFFFSFSVPCLIKIILLCTRFVRWR